MRQHDWEGVLPAITTPFLDTLAVDHSALATHVSWLADHGCRGIVALGSLGESATLTFDEKISILETCKRALGDRLPVVAGIAGLSTTECVSLAKRAAAIGCDGLMVLPPFFDEPEKTRPYFKRLRDIRDRLANENAFYKGRGELSMGMSHDFEAAIEEGATLVRVGTAIFGKRTYQG